MNIVIILFPNIGDECQSVWNVNPTKAMVMLRLRVDVLKILTTNDDDDDDDDDNDYDDGDDDDEVDNDWWWW